MRLFVLLCLHFCVIVSLASTLGFAEVFQKYQQSIMNHDTFKMYQYHDTILNQVSVSVSRYNSELSYPTLSLTTVWRKPHDHGSFLFKILPQRDRWTDKQTERQTDRQTYNQDRA